jgi:predicted Zn-dependent protease
MTMRTLKLSLLAALSALMALALAGCATNPATGRPMMSLVSPQEEQRTGREMHPQILREFGRYPDERVQSYVTKVGQSLVPYSEAPNSQWTFTVLDSPIVNAFALPGGYVYITRGLLALAQNEAELASVLGHEMGHVTARHAAQRQTAAMGAGILGVLVGAVTGSGELGQASMGAGQALVAGYSRDQEFEADDLGIRYIARAGYDVNASSSFLNRMGEHSRLEAAMMGNPGRPSETNIMSTHPRTPDRVARAAREAKASGASGNRVDREAFLAAIDGMTYGDSAEQGFVRGQQFVHPGLGIAFNAPQGYRLMNRSDSVVGQSQSGGLMIFDAQPANSSPANYIARSSQGTAQNIQTTTIAGFEAATGTVRGAINNRPVEIRIVAIRADQNTIYRFRSAHPGGGPNNAADYAASSFRRVSGSDGAGLQAHRIRVVTVQPGDTVSSLGNRMPFQDFREDRFRVLNGLPPGERQLNPGTRVKIVQ